MSHRPGCFAGDQLCKGVFARDQVCGTRDPFCIGHPGFLARRQCARQLLAVSCRALSSVKVRIAPLESALSRAGTLARRTVAGDSSHSNAAAFTFVFTSVASDASCGGTVAAASSSRGGTVTSAPISVFVFPASRRASCLPSPSSVLRSIPRVLPSAESSGCQAAGLPGAGPLQLGGLTACAETLRRGLSAPPALLALIRLTSLPSEPASLRHLVLLEKERWV